MRDDQPIPVQSRLAAEPLPSNQSFPIGSAAKFSLEVQALTRLATGKLLSIIYLLDGKYQTSGTPIGIQTIAKWAGNSPKVILRYYGRVRPEVYDQVTSGNEEIKSKLQPGGFDADKTPENTGSLAPSQAAQKAAQHTAVESGIEGNDAEEVFDGISPQSLKTQHLAARNGTRRHLAEPPLFAGAERTGFEPAEPLRVHGFSKPAH